MKFLVFKKMDPVESGGLSFMQEKIYSEIAVTSTDLH